MRIDWDKETGEWRVWRENGFIAETARHLVVIGHCEFITEGQNHHGWAVAAGEITRRGDTLFIEREKHG